MNPEQWLSLKWNGGSTMSDRWLNQSKIIQLKTGISVKELVVRRRSVKGRRIKRDLKTRENDTAYERKSDESSIINTIRIQKRMKSKKRLWRNSELLLLQYPLAQDIIHK